MQKSVAHRAQKVATHRLKSARDRDSPWHGPWGM